jgi:hypothetical protein
MQLALDILRERDQLANVVIIEAKDQPLRAFALPFSDDSEKRIAYQLTLLAGIAYDAEAITLLNEVWVATEIRRHDTTIEEMKRNALPPSKRENRKEAVMCLILYRDPYDDDSRRSVCSIREIERGADGKIVRLIDSDDFIHDSGDGAMMDLMLPGRPPVEAIRGAKHVIAALEEIGALTSVVIPLQ